MVFCMMWLLIHGLTSAVFYFLSVASPEIVVLTISLLVQAMTTTLTSGQTVHVFDGKQKVWFGMKSIKSVMMKSIAMVSKYFFMFQIFLYQDLVHVVYLKSSWIELTHSCWRFMQFPHSQSLNIFTVMVCTFRWIYVCIFTKVIFVIK